MIVWGKFQAWTWMRFNYGLDVNVQCRSKQLKVHIYHDILNIITFMSMRKGMAFHNFNGPKCTSEITIPTYIHIWLLQPLFCVLSLSINAGPTVDTERYIFLCQESNERKSAKETFLNIGFCRIYLTWGLNRGLTSNNPTYYLLDHANYDIQNFNLKAIRKHEAS